ncbi:MAG: NrtA/SsuA/CpmA family ABC transporter substrate-binding protein [Succiniclasticum sp.]|jgi:sulfonate transport system substrate-binding protein|nr:NrtA/SsuA/CpmA family ABC transporter substrate-binding protein [Succiniclasticum sp.]MCI6222264.1 NrtA/SsuA/CpmA family ABC transporter substrate-binding protein [Selenomonadales bacterium]
MKKLTLFLLSLFTLTAILTGCGGGQKAEAPKTAPVKELRVTYVKAPLNIPSIVDKFNETTVKAFEKDGTKVTFPVITSGAKQTEALAAGSLDIASCLGGTSAILAASNGADVKVVGIYSRAPKAFNIMVKDPSLKTAADLKGKRVVGPKGTILHQILAAALAKEKLTLNDVQFRSLGIPASVNALLSGEADAALVAGADVLRAQRAGARVLANGEGLVDATIVIGVSGKFLKEHPDVVRKYLALHQDNLRFLKEQQAKAYEFTAKETGLSVDDVKLMAPWYDFSTAITDKDIKDLEETQEFLLANGMQKNKIDIKSMLAEVK